MATDCGSHRRLTCEGQHPIPFRPDRDAPLRDCYVRGTVHEILASELVRESHTNFLTAAVDMHDLPVI
jgi:hypothetical protein